MSNGIIKEGEKSYIGRGKEVGGENRGKYKM